jgi:hypothetical protein
MNELRELDGRGSRPVRETDGRRVGASRARAYFTAGLVWSAVVLASWLLWWQIGPEGREALAATVGLPATDLAGYAVLTLVAEKLAAKGLLVAGLYQWLRGK